MNIKTITLYTNINVPKKKKVSIIRIKGRYKDFWRYFPSRDTDDDAGGIT